MKGMFYQAPATHKWYEIISDAYQVRYGADEYGTHVMVRNPITAIGMEIEMSDFHNSPLLTADEYKKMLRVKNTPQQPLVWLNR